MRIQKALNLTFEEQGERWRAAGGKRNGCWYGVNTPERRLWEKGYDREDARLAAIKMTLGGLFSEEV